MTIKAWVIEYLDALPAKYRIPERDSRLAEYARAAVDNGWSPGGMADAVAAGGAVVSVRSPVGFALARFRDLSATPYAALSLPPDAADAADWRDHLPPLCYHVEAVARGLSPNQCWPCRVLAGDPHAAARLRGTPCECPECAAAGGAVVSVPVALIAGRVALLAELNNIPAADMDARMRELIDAQRLR
jgi:hypothetical protein